MSAAVKDNPSYLAACALNKKLAEKVRHRLRLLRRAAEKKREVGA